MAWDILIRNALVFDGSGNTPQRYDVAVSGGRISAKGKDLSVDGVRTIIDGEGLWLTPGLLDIHTHFDLEVEVDPGLPEAVRHGTTSVVMSNCSLGIAFGKQSPEDAPLWDNPIVDCFARVENIPKEVLISAIGDRISWKNPIDYLRHFKDVPLGPNICPMLPHSMLRIDVMGMADAIGRKPREDEIQAMCEIVDQAMEAGFVGLSTDGLPLHYLANDPYRNERIPAQHATRQELVALADVVRRHDGIVQFTPNPDALLSTLNLLFMGCRRLYGKTLRMTATAAMDLKTNRRAKDGLIRISQLINSNFLGGHFVFQALSAPFTVYADGTTSPLMEEKPAFRELNALDLSDKAGRQRLLNDPLYCERFRRDWRAGKDGFNMARLLRKLGVEPTTFSRNLEDMTLINVPEVPSWRSQNMGELYARLQQYQASGGEAGAQDADEARAFAKFPNPIRDDADFMLHLLREYDRDFRWAVTTANTRKDVLKYLLFHEQTLPGFNDSGAHLTNMAYFDGNLRTLKLAQEDGIEQVSRQVRRLTRDAAELFGLDVGTLELGAQADLVLIDPQALRDYDSEANTTIIEREVFAHPQMVNRSDGVVRKVIIAGKVAWDGKRYTPHFGKKAFGRVLTRKGRPAPYPHPLVEPVSVHDAALAVAG